MLQRIGLAQALLNNPDLVFLDEPTSGLDPVGRRLVRDIIHELRRNGTTVFINSHLLSEVEVTCDRVAFIQHGEVVKAIELASYATAQTSVVIRAANLTPAVAGGLSQWGQDVRVDGDHVSLVVSDESRFTGAQSLPGGAWRGCVRHHPAAHVIGRSVHPDIGHGGRPMNQPIFVITRLTFREATRRRIVQAGLVLGVFFLVVFSIAFRLFTGEVVSGVIGPTKNVMQNETYNALTQAGLYAVAFMSLAMGTLLSADTLAGEISSGTVQTLVSNRCGVGDVVFGKWLGIASLIAVYLLLIGGGAYPQRLAANGVHGAQSPGWPVLHLYGMPGDHVDCPPVRQPHLGSGYRGVVFGLYGIAFIGGWVEQNWGCAAKPGGG